MNDMNLARRFREFDELSRRDFVSRSAAGLLGVAALPLLPAVSAPGGNGDVPLGPATAKNVIYLYMSGGMSQLDSFDPKPGASTMGPTKAIATNVDGVQVAEHFPNMARRMDRVAVINSMNSNQGAHAQGRYFMHTSHVLRGTIRHPSLGAWLDYMAGPRNASLPGHVTIGTDIYGASGGFLPSRHYPLPIGDPAGGLQHSQRPPEIGVEQFHRRLDRLQRMNRAFADKYDVQAVRAYTEMYEQAVKLMSSKDIEAFDITAEPASLREAYGDDPFAQGCLLARRLVEHKVRYIEVVSGGWDTHNQNFETFEEKGPVLDRALATLLADLEARGMLEETLVVLATEFGRTPDINAGRNGRDHYPKAFTCLLAGGGIRGGQAWGKTDAEGREIVEAAVSVQDFNATIAHALGLPLEHEVSSPSGRPFRVADKGKPVTALFA